MLRRSLFLLMSILLLLIVVPLVIAFQEVPPCVGEMECYEHPPEEPPAEPPPSSSEGWPGDDRLNPVADEYYTVYCQYDVVSVWVVVPSPQEINRIPIRRVIDGPFPFDAGNGLTVNRVDDTVTISGANGNGPNHPGSKLFSLNECIVRNGGEPPPAPPEDEPENFPTPFVPPPLPDLYSCENYFYAITQPEECGTNNCDNSLWAVMHLDECSDEKSSLEIIFDIAQACATPWVFVSMVGLFSFGRQRKRK